MSVSLFDIVNAHKKEVDSFPWKGITFLNEGKRLLPTAEAIRKEKLPDGMMKSALSPTK